MPLLRRVLGSLKQDTRGVIWPVAGGLPLRVESGHQLSIVCPPQHDPPNLPLISFEQTWRAGEAMYARLTVMDRERPLTVDDTD